MENVTRTSNMTHSKILILTLLLFITGFGLFFAYTRQEQSLDPSYTLTTLAFTNSGKEHLPKDFYEEALDLTQDNPINLMQFSLHTAEKRLLAYPFIEEVTLEKMPPDTLLIECVMRKPLFELADYDQVAIDREGYLFPLNHFYTPKKLPKVYLGLGDKPLHFETHSLRMDPTEMELILSLLKRVPQLKMIDLSYLNAESLGKQEIILTQSQGRHIRLPVHNWELALAHLADIPPTYKEVDLRYTKLALVR